MAKRQTAKIFLIVLCAALVTLLFFGCVDNGDDNNDNSIENAVLLTSHSGEYVLNSDGHLNNIDFSEITFKITYKNGDSKVITLEETMLTSEDRTKFETVGDHTLIITYEGAKITLPISVRAYKSTEKYNVIFNSMGGSSVPNQFTDVINTFIDPTKENYTFDGWYDNIEYGGEKLTVPYGVEEETTFYAKWIDNRRCNIKFLDDNGETVHELNVVYGSSVDPNDLTSYPSPENKAGVIFKGWQLTQGNNYAEITENIVFTAKYEKIKCFISINAENGFANKEYDYGAILNLSDYKLKLEDGHTARWIVFVGVADPKENDEGFLELDDEKLIYSDGSLTVNYQLMTIMPKQTIKNYLIKVYNGEENQAEENLKSGNIKLQEVFEDDVIPFKREYNSNFNLSKTDSKNDVYLKEITGYNVQWCFITTDKNGVEIWRNSSNQIWNDETGTFEGDKSTNFELNDKDGNRLAQVYQGNIIGIQNDLVLKPKYIKNNYTVTLYRKDDNGKNPFVLCTFTVPYFTDFKLYDPSLADYKDKNFNNWEEVENSYLKYTVSDFLTDDIVGDDKWQNAKWQINWYKNPSSTADIYKVDFRYDKGNAELGYYSVKENVSLYAQDVDTRTYNVRIYYDYNLNEATGNYEYKKYQDFFDLSQNQSITKPDDLETSFYYDDVNYTYMGLYDYPYEGADAYQEIGNDDYSKGDDIYHDGIQTYYLKTEYMIHINLDYHNKNAVYYAHYINNTSYDVYIYDTTQSEAYYKDENEDNDIYAVNTNLMRYKMLSGQTITSEMLFKGVNGQTGQFFYEQQYAINNRNSISDTYNALIASYGGDKISAISYLENKIEQKQEILDNYKILITKLQTYDYTGITKDYYLTYYGKEAGQYDMINTYTDRLKEICELNAKLDLLKKYTKIDAAIGGYIDNFTYYPYSDSKATLNEIEPGATDYYFAGWYYDSNYTKKADDICSNPDNPMEFSFRVYNSVNLYAKWVDKKKGSEGLIFQKLEGKNEVIVVDYLNASQYKNSIYKDNSEAYSKNVNDQGNMPEELGSRIELQIPSVHKFDIGGGDYITCSVVGIAVEAFAGNSKLISSVTLPNSLKFVEENVFSECNLEAISYQETDLNYIKVDGDKALYQNRSCSEYEGFVLDSQRTLKSYLGGVLLAYCNKSNDTAYDVDEAVLDTEVIRIGDNAFKGTSALQIFNGGDSLVSVGKNAFLGCKNLNSVNLPDTLKIIGAQAFKNCLENLENININTVNLEEVGKDAFENTLWKSNQTGLVYLGNFIVGLNIIKDGSAYARDDNGEVIEENGYNYIIGKDGTEEIFRIWIKADSGEVSKMIINKAFKGIADYAFNNYENNNGLAALDTIEFNAAELEIIGDSAFNQCSGLKFLYFKNTTGYIEIGDNILAGCGKNIAFIFPTDYVLLNIVNSWDSIKNTANFMEINSVGLLSKFYLKSGGELITLPEYVVSLGDDVFADMGGVKQIKLPQTLQSIGKGAFSNCTALSSLIIPDTVTYIGNNALYNCNAITSLTLPFIGDGNEKKYFIYLFGGNDYNDYNLAPDKLNTITLSNKVTEVADYAFYNIQFEKLILGENILVIGENSFYGNRKLTELNVVAAINSIGKNAFAECVKLSNVSFAVYSNLTFIDEYAFKNCIKLEEIIFNNKLQSVGIGILQGTGLKKLSISFIGEKLDASGAVNLGFVFGTQNYLDNTQFVPSTLYYVTIIKDSNNYGVTLNENAFYGWNGDKTIDLRYAKIRQIAENFIECDADILT